MRRLRTIFSAALLAVLPALAEAQSPAKTDTAKVDLSGKWHFTIEQPFNGTPTVQFTQKGDSLSGQYISNALGTHNFVGTVKGGVVVFSFRAESGGQSFVMAFNGKMQDADSMSGSIDFSGMAQGTFNARRAKPE